MIIILKEQFAKKMEHVPNVCIDWNTNGTFGRIFIQKKGSNKGLSVTIPLRCEHERSGL